MNVFLSPRLASVGVTLVLLVLGLTVASMGYAVIRGTAASARLLVELIPATVFFYAILVARRAIRCVVRGDSLAVAPLLARIGLALFAGGVARVFLVPMVARALRGAGAYAHFDISAITVGAIGVMLVILSGLVREGEAARAELDEMI